MKNVLFVAAGAALSVSSLALAQNADQSRAYSNELISDAGQHQSLLAANSTVEVGGQIQFRYIYNSRDDTALGDDAAIGFQTRRTKLWVTGTVGESFKYVVQGAFDRDDGGTFGLELAYGEYAVNDNWTARWGQFKLPLLREESISSKYQLAVERSETNEVYNQDYSQGVEFDFQNESWQFKVAFSDGLGTRNTDFISAGEADYAFTGRANFRWGEGDFDRFSDFTSWQGQDYGGLFGVAGHWQGGGSTVGTPEIDVWLLTADAQVEGNGWNAYGAFIWRNTDASGVIVGSESTDDLGWLVQGGIFLNENWEVFGRFDMVMPDDGTPGADNDFSTITVGVNDYIIPESHAAKFSADFVWFLDAQSESSDLVSGSTGTALLTSSEDSQFALRLQFQLLF